jgi:hypothetical protein
MAPVAAVRCLVPVQMDRIRRARFWGMQKIGRPSITGFGLVVMAVMAAAVVALFISPAMYVLYMIRQGTGGTRIFSQLVLARVPDTVEMDLLSSGFSFEVQYGTLCHC